MVTNRKEHTQKTPGKQAPDVVIPKPIKIGAATPYDFQGSNMTAYGGLLPVVTMLEKLQFQELIEQHVTIKRLTTSMPGFRFVLAMILALYVGFSRLNHLQFLGREPMLTGILEVGELPVQSTFWRFLASLHLVVARQLLEVGQQMRQRVWEAAHVGLKEVTLDTDTTVQTVYGRQMGARKGYNPKHRGKKSYQPILTFLAETREYVGGELRKGDRPTGKQIAQHLDGVFAALPNVAKLANDNGVKVELVKAGGIKGSGSFFHNMTPEERQTWQDTVDAAYDPFLARVAAGRPADQHPFQPGRPHLRR